MATRRRCPCSWRSWPHAGRRSWPWRTRRPPTTPVPSPRRWGCRSWECRWATRASAWRPWLNCTPTSSSSPRRTSGRPAACSLPLRVPRCSRGPGGPGRLSSRTTTTPSTAMTARRWARCRAWTHTAWPTPGPPARRWRPAFASAGPSCRRISSSRPPRPSSCTTAGRPSWTSSRSPTFSREASSTAICAACARSTAPAATRCWRRSRSTRRISSPPGSPPASTWWPGCRTTSARPP